MAKLWLVAKQEYRRIAGKKSFLISTLGVPLLFIALMVVIVLITVFGEDARPVGYVDHAGILRPDAREALGQDPASTVEIRPYHDEGAAQAALEAGAMPEMLFTTVVTTIIMAALPERFRRPLW